MAATIPTGLGGLMGYYFNNINKAQQFDTQDPINPVLNNNILDLQRAPTKTVAGVPRPRHEGTHNEFFAQPTAVSGRQYARVAPNMPNYNRISVGTPTKHAMRRAVVGGAPKQTTISDALVNTTLITTYRPVAYPF